jgi:hypothetical protein
MDQDVAGLADSYGPNTYAGSISQSPPEMMVFDKVDSGVVRYDEYLPPEFGWAPIAKIEHANTLLPTSQEGRMGAPEALRVKDEPVVMPRSEFTDTYPAMSDDGEMLQQAPDMVEAGTNRQSIYGTFVDGDLSDTPAQDPKQIAAAQAAEARKQRIRALLLIGGGALLLWYFSRRSV